MKEINGMISGVSKVLKQYERNGRAPKEVILYFEGLDCAGKSSTGNLIANALTESGYTVTVAQHNRPPTPEQRSKPWMDRGRFEYPEDLFRAEKKVPKHPAAIWDRGPAGDFVYGAFRSLSDKEKLKRFQEFKEYDHVCSSKGVLFVKLFFVSDRDSIAATLGKRLAVRKLHGLPFLGKRFVLTPLFRCFFSAKKNCRRTENMAGCKLNSSFSRRIERN